MRPPRRRWRHGLLAAAAALLLAQLAAVPALARPDDTCGYPGLYTGTDTLGAPTVFHVFQDDAGPAQPQLETSVAARDDTVTVTWNWPLPRDLAPPGALAVGLRDQLWQLTDQDQSVQPPVQTVQRGVFGPTVSSFQYATTYQHQLTLALTACDANGFASAPGQATVSIPALALQLVRQYAYLLPRASQLEPPQPTQVLTATATTGTVPVEDLAIAITVQRPDDQVVGVWTVRTDAQGQAILDAARAGDPDFGTWSEQLDRSLGVWHAQAREPARDLRSEIVDWVVKWLVNTRTD